MSMFVCIQFIVFACICVCVYSVGVDGLIKAESLVTCLSIPGGNVCVEMAWSVVNLW